ncbi:MAG: hypothetical protein C0403_18790, partial [Desulfobacterium sp.]|nr:hypothetical protein [Desulfobacterium sp.]
SAAIAGQRTANRMQKWMIMNKMNCFIDGLPGIVPFLRLFRFIIHTLLEFFMNLIIIPYLL